MSESVSSAPPLPVPPETLTLPGLTPPRWSDEQLRRLLELVRYWQETQRQGQPLSPEYLCRDCPELLEPLRQHLQTLEESTDEASQCLLTERPVSVGMDVSEATTAIIPGYELVQELGRGGMGVVYQAWQKRPRRLVALKMILAGSHAGPSDLARFRFEAEAVARLQHPNIVQVYDVGEHNGLPFFALEFCNGGRLDKKLAGTPLAPQEAARLVELLARAMHYAHQCGIVHRDLKPANVLLQVSEGGWPADKTVNEAQAAKRANDRLEAAIPKITDFGLAKPVDQSIVATPAGAILGTPSYMAPEQAGGQGQGSGPAVDIYALGAILYELLTARPPFKAAAIWDTIYQVLHDEPVSPRQLQSTTPRDLETICLKCLQKDSPKRYASAEELGEDFRRFLAGKPIMARPIGYVERALKWGRRQPLGAALLVVSFLGILSLGLSGWYFTGQVRQERDRALAEGERAEQQRDLAAAAARDAQAQLERSRRTTLAMQLVRASGLWQREPARGLALLEDNRYCPHELRDFAWGFFQRLCQREQRRLTAHTDAITSVAVAADGKTLATASWDGTVKCWDLNSNKLLWTTPRQPSRLTGLVWLPKDNVLAWSDSDGRVTLWDATRQQSKTSWQAHDEAILCLAVSPTGRFLATGSEDQTVGLWELPSGRRHAILHGHTQEVTAVQFGMHDRQLYSGSRDRTVRWWDAVMGEFRKTLPGHGGPVWSLAVSPDGKMVASGGADQTVRLWDNSADEEGKNLNKLPHMVHALAFAADGKSLAIGCGDGSVSLWDLLTGQRRLALAGHEGEVTALAFIPGEKRLVSAGQDRTVRIWETVPKLELATLAGHAWEVTALVISPDGQRLASGSFDDTIKVWDMASRRNIATLTGHTRGITALAMTPDGQTLISASLEQKLRLWDVRTAKEKNTLPGHTDVISCLAVSGDGLLLASGSADQTVKLWNLSTLREKVAWSTSEPVPALLFTADQQTLFTAEGGNIIGRNVTTGQVTMTLAGHQGVVLCLARTIDGRLLASGSSDRTVKIWDVDTGKELATLVGHAASVRTVAFTNQGRTLASGGGDGIIKVWDALTGLEQANIPAHDREVRALLFLPHGDILISGSGDKTIKIWGHENHPR